jgi:hypothetical protein
VDRSAALAALDNDTARKRLLDFVLKHVLAIPQSSYDWIRTDYGLDQNVLRVTYLFSLPGTRKIKRQSAAIGGDVRLTITVWAHPIANHRGLAVVSHQVTAENDVEQHDVHVLAPLTKEMDAVLW